MMTDQQLIKHFQRMISQKDAQIRKLREDLQKKQLIIDGLSETYERRFSEIAGKMKQAEDLVMKLMREFKGEWLASERIERMMLTRYRGRYTPGTIPRRCRALKSEGKLQVHYFDGHPHYALNLHYKGESE